MKKDTEDLQCAWCGLTGYELRQCGAPTDHNGDRIVKSERGDYHHCFFPGCMEEEHGANEKGTP